MRGELGGSGEKTMLKRILFFAYGLFSYLIFLVKFL
jgi:hypothetical protein